MVHKRYTFLIVAFGITGVIQVNWLKGENSVMSFRSAYVKEK